MTIWILNQNKKGGVYHDRKLRDRRILSYRSGPGRGSGEGGRELKWAFG